MSGLSRFDFYPRDWFLDTRDLSNAAKGIYIDILAAIYARGGGIPNDERELCRITGCATARSLRPLLAELLDKGKLILRDGRLINNRAEEEITKYEQLRKDGSKGGKARSSRVRAEFEPNSTGTQAETQTNVEEKQEFNHKPPSPSPSPISEIPKGIPGTDMVPASIFDRGVDLLMRRGFRDARKARAVVGRWCRDHGKETVEATLGDAINLDVIEPVSWMEAALRKRASTPAETDWDAEYRKMGVLL